MGAVTFELANRRGDPIRGDARFPDTPAGKLPTVVVCHGFKGFKDWGFFPHLGERLAGAGFLSLCFNFSGSGIGPDLQNFTELDRFAADTISQQIDDLGCVLDAIESGRVVGGRADLRRLGLLGHSRGAATAILRAHEDPRLRSVVTWAPVSSILRWSDRELAQWRAQGYLEFLNTRTGQQMRVNYTAIEDWLANRDRFDLRRAVAELACPLLIVHGEEDLSVRVEEGRELHEAAAPRGKCELVVLPHTGHTFGVEHPWKGPTPALERAIDRSIVWLEQSLGVPTGGITQHER
jgi:pimeloyl-ACP methyl ester carboxylesterase